MALTFINTNTLPRKASTGQGDVAEVLNESLCGAHNVHGSLRWLKSADTFEPALVGKHQLIYLLEGKGTIRLNECDYAVEKGAGVYLGPAENATVRAVNGSSLKLLHLVVPRTPK